ncbi:hypothetical protein AG1IA_06469 [Rhizoctonia solani AG-1 IA]|uniref:Uncharacterized protein n=1 Tax=Thanatephorus cucumeris (strain AG1-IA) TaxID=983506 RepID=L8WMW7_THACA|nr:hypothetical protein AG1IA_06469 [Rhizoctonia solani AG-1 IA]
MPCLFASRCLSSHLHTPCSIPHPLLVSDDGHPAESQNSDLARACSESHDDRFMPCRLCRGTPSRVVFILPTIP